MENIFVLLVVLAFVSLGWLVYVTSFFGLGSTAESGGDDGGEPDEETGGDGFADDSTSGDDDDDDDIDDDDQSEADGGDASPKAAVVHSVPEYYRRNGMPALREAPPPLDGNGKPNQPSGVTGGQPQQYRHSAGQQQNLHQQQQPSINSYIDMENAGRSGGETITSRRNTLTQGGGGGGGGSVNSYNGRIVASVTPGPSKTTDPRLSLSAAHHPIPASQTQPPPAYRPLSNTATAATHHPLPAAQTQPPPANRPSSNTATAATHHPLPAAQSQPPPAHRPSNTAAAATHQPLPTTQTQPPPAQMAPPVYRPPPASYTQPPQTGSARNTQTPSTAAAVNARSTTPAPPPTTAEAQVHRPASPSPAPQPAPPKPVSPAPAQKAANKTPPPAPKPAAKKPAKNSGNKQSKSGKNDKPKKGATQSKAEKKDEKGGGGGGGNRLYPDLSSETAKPPASGEPPGSVTYAQLTAAERQEVKLDVTDKLMIHMSPEMVAAVRATLGSAVTGKTVVMRIKTDDTTNKRARQIRKSLVVKSENNQQRRYARMEITQTAPNTFTLVFKDYTGYVDAEGSVHYDFTTNTMKNGRGSVWKSFKSPVVYLQTEKIAVASIDLLLKP